MRFLLLNQTFYPDVMATGQYLAEVAEHLVSRGHQVTVLTARRAYDRPAQRFPRRETWRGVDIVRIYSTGLGKDARWKRAVNFASFIASCLSRLLLLPRPHVVVALTSPPLISFFAAWYARLRQCRFVYWVMDLNPDEALAAGWLKPGSLVARGLEAMSRSSLRQAARIIVLDRFMRARLVAKGIPGDNIDVLPPWSLDGNVRFDPLARSTFRKTHGLDDKFVVMYSGNHSPCHPLDSLIEAARRLASESEILFCFVGGGSEWRKLRQRQGLCEGSSDPTTPRSAGHSLSNVRCLPYQPLDQLSVSLSAADLHVVVMGERLVGIVHPCKVYNLLNLGTPILYVGPQPSHVTEIFNPGPRLYEPQHADHCDPLFLPLNHGQVDRLIELIQQARAQIHRRSGPQLREPQSNPIPTSYPAKGRAGGPPNQIHSTSNHRPGPASAVRQDFSQSTLLPQLIHLLESD